MANPSLDALAAALEQTKWKLPPSLGELAAQLSRMLTAVRRAVQTGAPADYAAQAETLRRCAASLHTASGTLDATDDARAALDGALALAEQADAPDAAWQSALADALRAMRALCGSGRTEPHTITSAQADILCDVVLARARAMGLRLVAAVCDDGGNLLALRRDDDAFIASLDIAANKAFTAVSLKMPTKALAQLAAPGGELYGIQHTNGGRIVIFGGGVPITRSGAVIGGFGVSGGTAAQDTEMGDFAQQFAGRLCR